MKVKEFCQSFLRTMDPERAAKESGGGDGFFALGRSQVQERLERMRIGAAEQIRREDVLRGLAQMAFGRANDAMKLALHPAEADPETLELTAVSEFKVTDKGVEVKLIDRVRALEALHGLLDSGDSGAEELYRALEEAGPAEGGWEHE